MKHTISDKETSIVIAGGGGFLGRKVALTLAQFPRKHVLILDNWTCSSKEETEEFFRGWEDFVTVKTCDVTNDDALQCATSDLEDIDVIINFASIPTPRNYEKKPLLTFNTNLVGTQNLLNLAASRGTKIFVQASTSEIYGNSEKLMAEDDGTNTIKPSDPRACYAESKRAAETLCNLYAKQFSHMDMWILRLFNIYGPGMSESDGRVIPNFIIDKLKQRKSKIYGYRSRSYMYVGDFCRIMENILLGRYDPAKVPVNVVTLNIGDNTFHKTTLQLYKDVSHTTNLVLRKMGYPQHMSYWNYEIVENETTEDDPKFRFPNLSLMYAIFPDYCSRIGPEEGLERTAKYFIQRLAEKGELSLKKE